MLARPLHTGAICTMRLLLLACSKHVGSHEPRGTEEIGQTMRALIQRVSKAQVMVEGETVGAISRGMLVLLGVQHDDTIDDVKYLASKLVTLRVFEDTEGKMNCDLREHDGAVLVVSQFTLYADCRKGRRPSFVRAAPSALAEQLYEAFVAAIEQHGVPVATGRFGTHMHIQLVNDGPVTILLESPEQTHGV